MPLVDRSESLLAVVDTQPGFFRQPKMTDDERAAAAATVERIAWLAGLATLIDAGVEYNHFNGLVFEWLQTVAYAIETFEAAVARFGPFPHHS
jgi:hypothetical protein